jgi:predicted lactoylglutathione lyase
MNPSILFQLGKYASLTTGEITVEHAKELANALGWPINDSLVSDMVEILHADDDTKVLDYFFNQDTFNKFKKQIAHNHQAKTFLVACPKCSMLTVKPVMAVAAVEPNVVCNHCGWKIPLSEN